MVKFEVYKRGYTKKGMPIFSILSIGYESKTDREVVEYFQSLGLIKKIVRSRYPQFRTNLEDDFNRDINSIPKFVGAQEVKIKGFTALIDVKDYVEE